MEEEQVAPVWEDTEPPGADFPSPEAPEAQTAGTQTAGAQTAGAQTAGAQTGEGESGAGGPAREGDGPLPEGEGPPEELRQLARRLAAEHTVRQLSRQAAEAARERREVRSRIDGQLREIAALDPQVRTLEDLREQPGYDRICGMVERGYGLADAYRLANFDALTRRTAEATRQAALNSVAGRGHLNRTTARGSGAAAVPPELAEEYRAMVPGATEAEIQAHYNRYLKEHRD